VKWSKKTEGTLRLRPSLWRELKRGFHCSMGHTEVTNEEKLRRSLMKLRGVTVPRFVA